MKQTVDFAALPIFGIRHLSAAGACFVREYLEETQPDCVLIEGPSDATELLSHFSHKDLQLPIAILAYTRQLPVDTLLYPFASYSPEYQAICWAHENKRTVRLIDLPCANMISLHRQKNQESFLLHDNDQPEQPARQHLQAYHDLQHHVYQQLALLGGEEDYESYWERHFEHTTSKEQYMQALDWQTSQIRHMLEAQEQSAAPVAFSYNLLREAYMKRQIVQAAQEGYDPARMAVVCGAYHVAGLRHALPPMSDEELAALPALDTDLTLMPYSFFRLSSQSGYGAGNAAPAYYQDMYQCRAQGQLADFPAHYMSRLGRVLRFDGNPVSTAAVIEAVRLAKGLSSLRQGGLPHLQDLHDAAISCMGHGELSELATAFAKVDVGTRIGFLPEGMSQTPVQADMERQLKRLKLERYKTPVMQEIDLDLRENRQVKNKESAFLDLERSCFFHRLAFLGIDFAQPALRHQDSATWAERWHLQWTPEAEIQTVESNLKGESIEIAAYYAWRERLLAAQDVVQAATLVRDAYQCALTEQMDDALRRLQSMGVDSADFVEISQAAHQLSLLTQFGDIRKLDTECLLPILSQLFFRASLLLNDAASCDHQAAKAIMTGMEQMQRMAREQPNVLPASAWQGALQTLARRDDRHTGLSGLAFSVLLETGQVGEDECNREIARRLNAGAPADMAASWVEGLLSRNRYALLSRLFLWKELDAYVQSLPEEEFYRCVVYLRRAFGSFQPAEKSGLVDVLGDLWGLNAMDIAESIQQQLSPEEEKILDDLNEFDFGDLL